MDRRLLFPLILVAALVLAVGVACGDGDNGDPEDGDATAAAGQTAEATAATPEGTPEATAEPTVEQVRDLEGEANVAAAATAVIAALDAGDGEAIRALMTPDRRGQIDEEDLDELLLCWEAGARRDPPLGDVNLDSLEEQEIIIEQEAIVPARIDVYFFIEAMGRDVDAPWNFELQDDGEWLLSRLPRCLF